MVEHVFDVLTQSRHDRSEGVGVRSELEIQGAPEEPVAAIGAEELEGAGGIPGDVPPQRGASIGAVGLLNADGVRLDFVFVGQLEGILQDRVELDPTCLLYTSPSPRDRQKSRMPSSA